MSRDPSKATKFAIPRLKKSPGAEEKPGDSSEYETLSELVQSHLSLIKPPNGLALNKNLPNVPAETNEITVLSENVSKLALPGRSENEKFVIDLTAALTGSRPRAPEKQKERREIESSFEIPFVDCEVEISQPDDALECKLDVSDVLFEKCGNSKGASKFGKALCMRYRHRKPYKIDFSKRLLRNRGGFNFATLSPDDAILSCLRKA